MSPVPTPREVSLVFVAHYGNARHSRRRSELTASDVEEIFTIRPIDFDVSLSNMMPMSFQCQIPVLLTLEADEGFTVPTSHCCQAESDATPRK